MTMMLRPCLFALIVACAFLPRIARCSPDETTIAGRVIDGLDRPVADVAIQVLPQEGEKLEVARTGEDGRFSFKTDRNPGGLCLVFEKEGHLGMKVYPKTSGKDKYWSIHRDHSPTESSVSFHKPGTDFEMRRTLDRDVYWQLRDAKGKELDDGLREALTSNEWDYGDDDLFKYLFKYQAHFLPAMRRLIEDAHVGPSAKDWLDLIGDPADKDLFQDRRRHAPKEGIQVQEDDLVEAIKATARRVNWFTAAPEPDITAKFLIFDEPMNRALFRCGINLGPLSGVHWEFVYHKEGKRWVLRSMHEAGRS